MIQLIFYNALPLYGLIFLGFVLAKKADLNVQPIATIMLYGVLPIVMFGATGTMEFSTTFILPPLIIASISIIASSLSYWVSGRIWGKDDKRHNLLGLLGVSSNAAYFGVPIAVSIAGPETLGIYMMMVLPLFVLDCTLSYYFGVRSGLSVGDSLKRVTKLPIIYGAIGGLVLNMTGFEFTPLMLDYWSHFTGAMIVLGMMIIGVALARIENFRFDWPFFLSIALLRYLLWPLLGILWVSLDIYVLGLLDDQIHTFILLICACPLAANAIAYANKLNLHLALTSSMVLITTLLALFFIPFMMWVKLIIF